jgi:uncharacterized membrane protein
VSAAGGFLVGMAVTFAALAVITGTAALGHDTPCAQSPRLGVALVELSGAALLGALALATTCLGHRRTR